MTLEDFQSQIHNDIVVVDFMATRCGPCQAMFPIVQDLAQQNNIKLIKLDADDHAELFDHYEVYGVPHLKFFVNGQEKLTSTGPKQPHEIEQMIRQCVSYQEQPELALVDDYF